MANPSTPLPEQGGFDEQFILNKVKFIKCVDVQYDRAYYFKEKRTLLFLKRWYPITKLEYHANKYEFDNPGELARRYGGYPHGTK